MNFTYRPKNQDIRLYELTKKRLQFHFKEKREVLTPEEMAKWNEIERMIEELNVEPQQRVDDAIARIRSAYPFTSNQQDEEQRKVFDLLYEGKITEAQAWFMMLRQEQRRCIRNSFDNKKCHLAWESYLQNAKLHFPPRPIQTRLAVHAARKANIITLYGGSGLGKTTAAIRGIVLRGVDSLTNRKAIAISGSNLSRMSAAERSDFVDQVKEITASLLLDDIDKGGKAEGVSSAILEIIEAREHLAALTIITTNCNGAKLSNKLFDGYGSPIVTRIKRGITIDFDDEDIDESDCRLDLDQKLQILNDKSDFTPKPRKVKFRL